MAKEILCGFGIDVDAVAGWLGSYGGEDSPDDISRGLFAGEVGSPRLLRLFGRLGIRTTWFIPSVNGPSLRERQWAIRADTNLPDTLQTTNRLCLLDCAISTQKHPATGQPSRETREILEVFRHLLRSDARAGPTKQCPPDG